MTKREMQIDAILTALECMKEDIERLERGLDAYFDMMPEIPLVPPKDA